MISYDDILDYIDSDFCACFSSAMDSFRDDGKRSLAFELIFSRRWALEKVLDFAFDFNLISLDDVSRLRDHVKELYDGYVSQLPVR